MRDICVTAVLASWSVTENIEGLDVVVFGEHAKQRYKSTSEVLMYYQLNIPLYVLQNIGATCAHVKCFKRYSEVSSYNVLSLVFCCVSVSKN